MEQEASGAIGKLTAKRLSYSIPPRSSRLPAPALGPSLALRLYSESSLACQL